VYPSENQMSFVAFAALKPEKSNAVSKKYAKSRGARLLSARIGTTETWVSVLSSTCARRAAGKRHPAPRGGRYGFYQI
jgi:hypothetical protein